MNPSNSAKGGDKDKIMEELERARIASSLQSRRLQALIRRAEWVPEARKEVAARKEFKKTMDIFPDLVWEAILERVADSKDKAVMSNMTEMWWKLCQGERAKFLFQDVFSILHSKGYLSKTNDMLNCRLVCKEWKRSIEDYLQSSESKTDLDFLDPKPLPMLELNFPCDITYLPLEVQQLLIQPPLSLVEFLRSSQIDYSGVNPFISRKIIFGSPNPGTMAKALFWRITRDVLQIWGRELWELSICFDRKTPASVLYREICEKLSLCPNLRYLRIISNEYGELYDYSKIGDQMHERRQLGQYIYGKLLNSMKAKQLPNLPYLKSLQTTFVPAPIIQAMIRKYGSTLETLCGGAFEAKPSDYVEGQVLPVLREFKSFYFAPRDEEAEVPFNFTAEWPNFKELTLLFDNVQEGNILELFESLNRFPSEGLRKLTLHLHKEYDAVTKLSKSIIKQLSLELPGLEVMTLSVLRINLSSIDFLLPLVNLKELNLIYMKYVEKFEVETGNGTGAGSKKVPGSKTIAPRDELIKVSDYINRLYESNIWRVFPELKIVRIGVFKTCTSTDKWAGKWAGGRSTEQQRLLQIREVPRMSWEAKRSVQTKRKVYTREGYELRLKTSN